MNFNPLLWFVCRFCKQAMPDLDRLKAHTLDNHMGECLEGVQIECIVFEESILDHECATASKAKKNAHPKINKSVSSVNVNGKKPQNHITNGTPSAPSISEQEGSPSKLGLSTSVALTRLSPKKVDPPKFDETKTKTTKYIAGPKCYKAKKRKLSNSISSSCIKENDDNKDSPAPKQNRLQPSDDKICENLDSVISKEPEVIVIDDDDDEPQEKPVPPSSEFADLDVNEECEAEATLELDDQSGLFLIRNPDGTVTEITNGNLSPDPEPEAILISIPAVETFPGTTTQGMNFDIHEHADLLKINQVPAEPHQQAFSTTIPDCFSVLNDSVTVSIADSTAANFEFQLLLNNSNDDSQNESQVGANNIVISTQNIDLAGPASDTSVLDVSEIGTEEQTKQLQQLRQDVGMDFNFNTAGKNGKKIKKKFVAVLKKKMMKESSLSNLNLNSRREDKQVQQQQLIEVVSVPSDSDASYTEISSTSTIVNSNNNYSNLSNSDSDSISVPNNIHYEDTQELDNQQFFISSANISQLSISNEMDVEIVADSEQDDPNSTPILTPVPISVQFQFPSTEAFTSATNTITTSSTQDFDDFDDGMNLEQLKLKQQLQQQQPQLVGYTSISDFIGCLSAPAEQHQQQEDEPMKDSVSSSSVVTIPTSNFDFELIHGTNSEVDSNNYLNPKNAIITCDSSDLAADLIIERNTDRDIVHENRNKFQESTELVPPDTTVTNDNDKENGEEDTTSLPLELQESSSPLSPPPMIDLNKSIESQNDESEDHQSNACNNTDDDENTLQTVPTSEIQEDEHQNKLQNIQSEIQEEPQNKLQTGEHPDVNRVEYRERSRSPVPVTQQTEDQTIFLMDNDFIDYACEEVVETSSSSAEATGESTVTEEIAMHSETHPDFEPTVDAAECGDEIQNEGGESVEIETPKATNDATVVEVEKAGGDVNISSLDNQLQNQTEVENDEISETVNPDLPSPETSTAETGAEPEPEKTDEQPQQSQPELVDLPSTSTNCEAPEVVDTETNCETPEVVEADTNCVAPEVVDADTNCEAPEVGVDTEVNCETPEVVLVATETNFEVPEAVDAEISVTTSVATTDVTYNGDNDTSEASFGMKSGVVDPECSPCAQENLSVESGPEPENENTSLPQNTAATSDNLLNKDDDYIENGKIPAMDPLSAYYSNISESESELDESHEAISPTTTTTTTTTATTVTTTEINVSIGDTNSNEDSNKNTTTKLNGSLVFIAMDVPVPAPTSTPESESVLSKKTPSLSRTLSHYDTWRKMSKNNLALPTENTTTSANVLQHNAKIIKTRHFEDRLDEEKEIFIPSPTPVTVTTPDDVVMNSRKTCESDQNKKELPHQQLPALPQKFRNHIRKKLMSGKKKKLKLIKKKLKKSACISVPKVRLVFDDKKIQSDNEEEKEVENDIGAENSFDVEEGETQAPISPPSPIPAPIVIPIAASLKSNPKSLSSKTDLVEEKKVEENPKSQVELSPIQSKVQKEQKEGDEQGENISSSQPTPFKLKLKPSSALGSVSPKSPHSNKSGGKKKIAVVNTRTISRSKLNSNVKKKLVSSRRQPHKTNHSPVQSQGKNDADDDIQIVFISDDKVTPKGSKSLSKYQDVPCDDDDSSDGGGSDLDYKPSNHHAKTKTKIRSKTKPKIRNNKFKFNTQQKTKRQKLRKILKKPSVKTRASITAPSVVKSSVKSKLLSKKSNEMSTTSKLQLSMIQSNKSSQKAPPQSQTKPTKKGTFLSSNSLVRWLALQKELSNSKSIKFPNVILLDPDPTLMSVTSSEPPRQTSSGGKPWQTSAGSTPGNTPAIKPRFEINRDKPVTCKLCSQKLISELQLQNHVENCWLHNKQRHRFCIKCNRGFDNPVQLTQHNKSEHSDNSKVTKVTVSPASGRVTVPVSPISSSSSTKAKIGLPLLTPRPKRAADGDGKEVDNREKPKPKNVIELSLKQWLVKEAKMNPSNIIALDPDPVSTSKTLISISKSSPIKCKLCQAYLTSESRVKKHVALCWTSNKSKHVHCVQCNKSFAYTKGFQRHNMDKHFDSWKDRRQAKKVVRRDWELEEEEDPPLAKRVKLTKENSAVPVAVVRAPAPAKALVKDATVLKPKPKLQPSPIHIPAPVAATTLKPKTHSKQEKLPVPVVRLEPVKDIVKPVVCKICSMTFNAVSGLTRHVEQVHTRERPHKCPHCPATYKTLEEFRRHVGTHGKAFSPDKREPCRKQVNSKTTPEKNQRDRIHKGVTHALKCSVANCTATCTSHSSLSNHLRLKHNIESPQKKVQEQFICPTFDLQDELTRSLKLKRRTLDKDNNNSKPYKCTHPNCDISGFRTKIQLDKHVKDEHKKAATPPTPIATTTSRKRKLSQADADRHVPVPVPVSSARTPNSTPTLNRPTPKVRCLSPDICDF